MFVQKYLIYIILELVLTCTVLVFGFTLQSKEDIEQFNRSIPVQRTLKNIEKEGIVVQQSLEEIKASIREYKHDQK
jgi:hypothetical protein